MPLFIKLSILFWIFTIILFVWFKFIWAPSHKDAVVRAVVSPSPNLENLDDILIFTVGMCMILSLILAVIVLIYTLFRVF